MNLAVLFAALLLAPPPPAPRVYNGRLRHLEVHIPRFDEGLKLDGVLDEPVWKQAAVLTGFSQFSPADGIAADDSIEVLVWYSATAINFGVRAFETHGAVHATLASRDKIDSDDYVQFLIGTFNDGRQAMLFGVNPFGVQQDGIITETGILRGGSGFGSAGSVREAPDLNPDFVFRSRGTLTEYGYEVEVSIPFKTLRFQPTDSLRDDSRTNAPILICRATSCARSAVVNTCRCGSTASSGRPTGSSSREATCTVSE